MHHHQGPRGGRAHPSGPSVSKESEGGRGRVWASARRTAKESVIQAAAHLPDRVGALRSEDANLSHEQLLRRARVAAAGQARPMAWPHGGPRTTSSVVLSVTTPNCVRFPE